MIWEQGIKMKKFFITFLLISSCGIFSFSAPTIGGPTIGPSSGGSSSGNASNIVIRGAVTGLVVTNGTGDWTITGYNTNGSSGSGANSTNLYLGVNPGSGIYLVNSNLTSYATNSTATSTNNFIVSGSSALGGSDGTWYWNTAAKGYTNASFSGAACFLDVNNAYGNGANLVYQTNSSHKNIPTLDVVATADFNDYAGESHVWNDNGGSPNGNYIFGQQDSGYMLSLAAMPNIVGVTTNFTATNDYIFTMHKVGSTYVPRQTTLYDIFAVSNAWIGVGDFFSMKTIGNSDPGQILMSSTVHVTGHGVVWLGANSGDIVIGPSPSHGIFQMGSTGIGGSELYVTYEAGATAIAGKTWSHPLSFRAQAWNGSSAVDCFASIVAMATATGSAANAGNAEFVFYSRRPYWAFGNTNILAPDTAGTEVFRLGTNGAVLNWGYVYKGNGSGLTNLTNSITGTTAADNAAAGFLGEFLSSYVASGSAKNFNSLNVTNVTSLSLTAGDWDVEGNLTFIASVVPGVFLKQQGTITSTTATIATDGSEVNIVHNITDDNAPISLTLPRKRFNVSSTTTVYLVAGSDAAGGTTIVAYGGMTARRVR